MKSKSKSNLTITFWVVFLMINFKDLILIFYIWVSNTTIEGIVKKYNLNNTLLLLLGVWPKKNGFSILEHFFPFSWQCLLPSLALATVSISFVATSFAHIASTFLKIYVPQFQPRSRHGPTLIHFGGQQESKS